MPEFHYAFTVKAPAVAVAEFHHDTRALRRLTPPPVFVQLHRVEPLGEGSVSEFTMWFGPLPVRWVAVHSQVSADGFTDTQERGPLQHWRHTHRFVPADPYTTRVEERIAYEHRPGPWGWFTRLLFGRMALQGLFAYRRLITRRALERQTAGERG